MNNKEELQKQIDALSKEISLTKELLKEKQDKKQEILNKLKLVKDNDFKEYVGKCYLNYYNDHDYTIFKIIRINIYQDLASDFTVTEIVKNNQDYSVSFYDYKAEEFISNEAFFKEISTEEFNSIYAKFTKEISEKMKINK